MLKQIDENTYNGGWFDFWEHFTPIENPFDNLASLEGVVFGLSEEELAFVQEEYKKNPETVWTYHTGDDEPYISSGLHYVNREGYIITQQPAEAGMFYTFQDPEETHFVIFSHSEGFWSNNDGWVADVESADLILEEHKDSVTLPFTSKNDVSLVDRELCECMEVEELAKTIAITLAMLPSNNIQLQKLLLELGCSEVTYEGDSLWLINNETYSVPELTQYLTDLLDISSRKELSIYAEKYLDRNCYIDVVGEGFWLISKSGE